MGAWDEDEYFSDESFEDRLTEYPPHVWLQSDGQDIEIIDMTVSHARNTVRLIEKWVREGRGVSPAGIVGEARFENLKRRANDPDTDAAVKGFTKL